MVGKNPFDDFDYDLIPEKREPIILPTDAEVDAAIASVPPMMGHMMRLAEKCGMRENEIVTLERNQRDGECRSTPQIRLTKTKTSRPRVIPLAGPILEEADAVLAGVPNNTNSSYFFWHG